MKKILLILISINCLLLHGQKLSLTIKANTILEQKTIDSINYSKNHTNISSILSTIKKFDSTLFKLGYIEASSIDQKKTNDSSFMYVYKIGKKLNKIIITTEKVSLETKDLLNITKDTVIIPFKETENWLTNKLQILEKKGYSLAKIKLTNQSKVNSTLYSNLEIDLNTKRQTDELIILGYEKFPKNYKYQMTRKLKNKVFNQKLVSKIHNDLNNLKFITQIKYPEILFTENKTKIYAYVNKSKPNKFDGFIGFSNNENQKLIFNGYLDILLINTLNSGEQIKAYWKNDGNQQTLFNLGTEIPFLIKTPLGIKSELNIFKQDSTFQNTKIDFNLGYSFSFNKKAYIGFQKTASVDIQNKNLESISDFKNHFYTLTYEFKKNNSVNPLLPEISNLFIRFGTGKRNIKTETNQQYFAELNLSQLIIINNKNNILLKNQSYLLKSNNYLSNEQYRFGGINSIRGFRENSLQANTYSAIMTEYRYLITPTLIIHSISDFGYQEDKTTSTKNHLLGVGLGIELLTNNGLLNFIYSNGSTNQQKIELSNSIIQVSFKTNF